MVKHLRALEHLGIIPLKQKRVKNPQKSAIMDHPLLEDHNATYDDFSILIPENNQFKLQLRNRCWLKELNRNIYTHPLELFA